MSQRVAYSAVAIAIVLAVAALDVGVASRMAGMPGAWADLFRRGSVIPVAVAVVALLGGRELSRLLRQTGIHAHARFAHLMIAGIVLCPWLSAAGWLGSRSIHVEGIYWPLVGLLMSLVGTAVLAVARGRPEGAIRDSAATLLMIVYLGFAASFAVQIRCSRGSPDQQGAWLLLIAILVTKSSDMGAYFVGTKMGRHKLSPRISPGKSIEGTIGGILASALVGLFFGTGRAWFGWFFPGTAYPPIADASTSDIYFVLGEMTRTFSLYGPDGVIGSALRGCVFGLILSVVGQIGDLFESCFKREAGLKDSGHVMPRFGGILDLIDSPILTAPVAWFLFGVMWNIV